MISKIFSLLFNIFYTFPFINSSIIRIPNWSNYTASKYNHDSRDDVLGIYPQKNITYIMNIQNKKGNLSLNLLCEYNIRFSYSFAFLNYLRITVNNITNLIDKKKDFKGISKNSYYIFQNNSIYFNNLLSFIYFLKNKDYINKYALGFNFVKYNKNEKIFFDIEGWNYPLLGGLSEKIKENYNYKESFKFKQFINLDESSLAKYNIYQWELNEKISDLKLIFPNQTIYSFSKKELNDMGNIIFDFTESLQYLCIPFHKFRDIFLNDFLYQKIFHNYYGVYLSSHDNIKKYFPNITLTFNGKEIFIPADIVSWEHIYKIDKYCRNIIFGKHFFKYFNAIEIDLENMNFHLFSNDKIFQDKNIEKNLIKNNSIIKIHFVFIVVIIFISFIIFLFHRNNKKKKYLEWYNNFYKTIVK